MTAPHIAAREPIRVELKAGESYWWCACGRSQNQPFCDGSHEGTSFQPKEFTPDRDRVAFFCACKHSKNAPLCDGTHKTV